LDVNVVITVNAGKKDHVHVIKRKILIVSVVLIVHVKTMANKVVVVVEATNKYH
jgi:hypothetical protein